MEEEQFIDFTRARQRQNGRIQYSRDELLEIGRKPGLSALPAGINMSVIRELEELTFFDSGPKPEWGKDKGYGRLDFLRPGGGFGGPIRSRLVGDGSLPEELPPARSLEPHAAPRPSESLDIRRASSWRPPAEAGGQTPPGDRWNGPVTPGRRPAEEYPARRGRWDEAKTGTTPERDNWRSNSLQSPSNGDERSWRGLGPAGAGAPGPGPPGPPGPPGRWGDEERARGAGRGAPRGSLEERELPRRPPPGMGHEDKWTRAGPPPGGWEHERDREWGGKREGGYGGPAHWDRDPSWMHDGQQPGEAANAARLPPPPARAGAMTAKDIERERQEMQAQWRAQAAANKANEEDDLAFLRSDSDEDEPSGIRPPAAAHLETAGSHPSRSRFFDVPSGDNGGSSNHQQQQQPGTPSGDPSVVGRKLTFDQFKAAAAGSASGPAGPSAGEQPLQHQGSGAAGHAKAVTLAEIERQVSGGHLQQPPPPPPPPAGPGAAALPPPGALGADKRVDTEASKKLMAFLKKPAAAPAAAAAAPQVMKPPPGMGFASPTAAPAVQKHLAPSGLTTPMTEPTAANAPAAAASAAGFKHAAASTSEPAASHEADSVDDLAKLAGLLDLGLEEDTAASGLAAKLASLAKGDSEVAFGGRRDSATGLSPTLGGFDSVLGGSKQVPSALAGIWGSGLGVWDHAPKSTGAAGPSLLPAGTTPFAAAAGAVPAGPTATSTAASGPPLGVGLRAAALGQGLATAPGLATGVSGPPSSGAGGGKSPATVPSAGAAPGTAQGTNALAQLLASAAAGAQGAARPPTASMPFTSGPAGLQQTGMQQAGLGQTGLSPAAVGQMGGIARPQVPGAAVYGAAGPGSGSGGIAASNPLAMLFAGQAKQAQQQQQAQQQALAAGLPGVGAGPGARPPGVNLQAQQLLQQQQGQQQSNLAGLMQHFQQQAQQQALAAGRAGMTLQQAQHQQLQQQQAQQRAAAAATLTQQQHQQQQLLGAARPQQPQPNLQYLLHQQQQQAQLRQQQQQQQQQQQLMLAQQLAQNQAVQAASFAARSAAMGGVMPPNQFMQGAQLPAGFGGMPAAQRPGMPQGFGMAPPDQQAQLRQLLSQAQQRVPGMPGMS